MHAVILAGGQGTRLRPLTYSRRKELIPLLNRPLLEYRLLNLREHGVTDVALACSQGAGEIEQHFGDGAKLGLRMTYHYEDRPLGSGRAVKEAARAASASGTLVVCNGDILTNVNLSLMLEQHRATRATLSMSLAPVDDPWTYGVAAVDGDLRIEHFVEKPPQGQEPSNLINAGTWIWEPEVLDRIPDDETAVRDGFSERVLFPGIIDAGLRVQGYREDLWVDVGSPERYTRATRLLLERSGSLDRSGRLLIRGKDCAIEAGAGTSGMVLLGDGVVLARGAAVSGPSVIGPGVRIGAGATINSSVVWEGARVGAQAVIGHSIIGGDADVGVGARLFDAVLADGARIADGCVPHAGLHLKPGEAFTELAPYPTPTA